MLDGIAIKHNFLISFVAWAGFNSFGGTGGRAYYWFIVCNS